MISLRSALNSMVDDPRLLDRGGITTVDAFAGRVVTEPPGAVARRPLMYNEEESR
ncbi:hypothetical protein QFZ82_001692 [Streptomyces sp. V4I23]|uniref:hypothetical protein n=1 Tax=Streptomyces sp. V4I23 TaxID=3042282 RepID=UPI00278B2C2E|nr:hypothetical protein [Streptomyces sp. V4I23]MDQ1007207.1 hypothetical protein [Streptomyces sp. V4I23]